MREGEKGDRSPPAGGPGSCYVAPPPPLDVPFDKLRAASNVERLGAVSNVEPEAGQSSKGASNLRTRFGGVGSQKRLLSPFSLESACTVSRSITRSGLGG
jgi:hypothetical protein